MSWGEICRLCLRQGLKTYNIYSESVQDSAVTMTIRIKWVAELEVTQGDGLPNQVCQPCVEKLNAGYEFKRQCLISDKTLRKFMSQTNNNNTLTPETSAQSSQVEGVASSSSTSPQLVEVKEEPDSITKAEPTCSASDNIFDPMNLLAVDPTTKVEAVYNDSDSALDLSLEAAISAEEPLEDPPPALVPSRARKQEQSKIRRSFVLTCQYCDKRFYREKSFDAHVKEHGLPVKKEFKCGICEAAFDCLSLYDQHSRTHSGKKIFCCPLCCQSFSTQGSLTVHKKSHTGQKDYKCHICAKSFTVQGSLTTHLRTHTREKPYKCTSCDKCFSVQRDLNRHARCHTGERNYKCDHCEKTFSRRDSLTSHVRVHQGIKPYQCNLCKNSYPSQSILTKHLKKVHGASAILKCSECPKEFAERAKLLEHAKSHERGVTFKCPDCEKTFSKQSLLTKHYLAHKEDLPYKCDRCVQSFAQQINLTRHIRNHLDGKL